MDHALALGTITMMLGIMEPCQVTVLLRIIDLLGAEKVEQMDSPVLRLVQ